MGAYTKLQGNFSNANLQKLKRLVDLSGAVSTVIASGATNVPTAMVANKAGTRLYIAEQSNSATQGGRILQVNLDTSPVTVVTLAGAGYGAGNFGSSDGIGVAAKFSKPMAVALSPDEAKLYVADSGSNELIREVVISTGQVTTIAGTLGSVAAADGTGLSAAFVQPYALSVAGNNLYIGQSSLRNIRRMNLSTLAVTTINPAPALSGANWGLVVTEDEKTAYVSNISLHAIFKIDIATGTRSSLAGTGSAGALDGVGTAASFNSPRQLAFDESELRLYVAESGAPKVRKVNLVTSQVSLVAGSGVAGEANGTGVTASFQSPYALALPKTQYVLYVLGIAGSKNVRKVV